jgi:hypothetical protein
MTTISSSTTTNRPSFHGAMSNDNHQLFQDDQIQRYDADTIKHHYGDSWKSLASNVREIAQPDGSIVKGIRPISRFQSR